MSTRRRVPRGSGEWLPRLCLLFVALLFTGAISDRAYAHDWRSEQFDPTAAAPPVAARVDASKAEIPVVLGEARHAAAVVEARAGTDGSPCPGISPVAAQLRPARATHPAPGRAESLPGRRFLTCGYMSAPPTAPPVPAPLT